MSTIDKRRCIPHSKVRHIFCREGFEHTERRGLPANRAATAEDLPMQFETAMNATGARATLSNAIAK
jgi:hypothetical protein